MIKIKDNEKQSLNKRINRIIGQLNGISRMINDNRSCEDILIQIGASNSALKRVGQELLKSHMETCMKDDILNGHDESIKDVMDLVRILG
jgi:CsoR family transcriptional regulator, copper-sensing transcriptional repressor